MPVSVTAPAPVRHRPHPGLLYLVLSGLLWGTGGLTGTLLRRATGLSAISVADYRLLAGGGIIVVVGTVCGRRWPQGRAAWARIAVTGLLAARYLYGYTVRTSHKNASRPSELADQEPDRTEGGPKPGRAYL
jgi:DME family drug/metabolite transporter